MDGKNPNKESNVLQCKLNDVVIKVKEEELIENNIIEKPLFVVIADFAEDLYVTDTRIASITNNYTGCLRKPGVSTPG